MTPATGTTAQSSAMTTAQSNGVLNLGANVFCGNPLGGANASGNGEATGGAMVGTPYDSTKSYAGGNFDGEFSYNASSPNAIAAQGNGSAKGTVTGNVMATGATASSTVQAIATAGTTMPTGGH
jgi:hypothetical protein